MKFRNYIKILFLLLAAAGMAGCVKDYVGGSENPTPENSNDVTITVNIPGQQIPTTRAMSDEQQAKVESIDILVFKPDGTLDKHVEGKNIDNIVVPAEGTDPTTYKVKFKAALPVSTDARTVAIVANVENVSTLIGTKTDKADILEALIHTSAGKWDADATPDYIPMYGEKTVTEITGGMNIDDIELIRMLARIDVVNSASGFTLTNVYLVNRNTAGYVAPAWGSDGVLSGSLPATPMPPTSNVAKTGEVNALDYPYSGTGLAGEIYTYEAAATSGIEADPSHTNAICLIVKGKWLVDNNEYYYRIDFTADGNATTPSETRQYMPVYRNHLYTFTIGAVNGVGFPATPAGFESALNSLGVMNNLKTNLHTVDMSGIKHMVFNGQHYIGLSQVEYGMIYGVRKGNELTILTNAKDLSATPSDSWIKNINKGIAEPISGGGIKYTLTFDIDVNNTHKNRNGKIILTAGRLMYEVNISQFRGCYPAYPGVIGYDPVIGDLNLEGRGYMVYFKFGSVVAMYAGFNGDTWSIDDVAFNPSGIDCTEYGNVPFQDSKTTFPDHDPTTTGKGDPCRLVGLTKEQIASGNTDNAEWRLPTSGSDGFESFGTRESIYIAGGGVKTSGGNITAYKYEADARSIAAGGYGNLGVISLEAVGAKAYSGDAHLETYDLILPTSGYRRSNNNGVTQDQGITGRFWSQTPSAQFTSETAGYYLGLDHDNVSPRMGTYGENATCARCIRR